MHIHQRVESQSQESRKPEATDVSLSPAPSSRPFWTRRIGDAREEEQKIRLLRGVNLTNEATATTKENFAEGDFIFRGESDAQHFSSSPFGERVADFSRSTIDDLQVLKVGFRLALNERNALLQQYERLLRVERARRGQQQLHWRTCPFRGSTMKMDRVENGINGAASPDRLPQTMPANNNNNNSLLLSHGLVESITMSSPKLNNRETEVNSRNINGLAGAEAGKPVPSPKFNASCNLAEMFVEPVDDESGDFPTTWEFQAVNLSRVPGYGFGIAVSGGRDNPHFKSGDPSIVVSDVLRAGPAWGLLQVNDRIISANGIGLEHADYTTAVQIMKENEQLNLIVKRRVPLPTVEYEQRTLKFTLTKSRRKDDFGIVLGCKFYVKGITNKKLAEKEPGLKPGDVVLKINGQDCEEMTLPDAKKLLEKSRERLALVVQRDVPRGAAWKWPSQATLYERLGPCETPRQSPVPRSSPMVGSRYSDGEGVRLNNAVRLSGRYSRLTSSEYCASPKRHSYGSQPPSRSRTPSQSVYDDYSNFSPRGSLPQTPPPRLSAFSGDDCSHLSPHPSDSPLVHKPPLPSPYPEPRFISFLKEGGSVGVRVIGGNEVGIFVSAVQAGSPAATKGVRSGDKILRVNNKDMRGVSREEAVLFLLGVQDQVDLVVQYRKDEYDRIRAQNLGDNFYIRTHFDYDKPEQGELCFRKGDIFQVTDTLFGGTVGAWQAVRVSSPSTVEKTDSNESKGVIPNGTRAEQLLSADVLRASRSTTNENRTTTLLRKKVSLARRSKSLTKGHWDEVVFAHGSVNFPAYEHVKLRHPGFLRPVVLFGALSDVAREQLLQDFPLRFASPQNDTAGVNNNNLDNGCGVVKLSAIREIMNKNKHCLLDVTPHSVEKLQYAQYCPIVIFINVENRSRLRELRKRHSKAAASKNSRKLQEQAAKIQKMYGYLFTAVLDASHEDHWFEALRELISHLQERRVWMAESRPSDLLDDDFLFPMANNRNSGNYAGDSDVDSLRGDGDYGSPNIAAARGGDESTDSTGNSSQIQSDRNWNGARAGTENLDHAGSVFWRSQGTSDVYANRDVLIDHIATLRRPDQRRERPKPKPPPRYAQYPPLPPKPQLPASTSSSSNSCSTATATETNKNGSTSSDCTSVPPAEESVAKQQKFNFETHQQRSDAVFNLHAINECLDMPACSAGPQIQQQQQPTYYPAPRNNRYYSEPGFYDVKQILAEQNDDYANRTALGFYDRPTMVNGCRSPGHFENGGQRFTMAESVYSCPPPMPAPPRPHLPNGRHTPVTALSNSVGPTAMAYVNSNGYEQSKSVVYNLPNNNQQITRTPLIARTSSLPTGPGAVAHLGHVSGRPIVRQQQPSIVDYHRRIPPVPNRSPVPPPAPAPRSPHPHSPRVVASVQPTMTPVRFADDDYASLPTIPNGDGYENVKEMPVERHNGGESTILNSRSTPTGRENYNASSHRNSPSLKKPGDKCNGGTTPVLDLAGRDAKNVSAFELYNRKEPTQNGISENDEPTDPHDTHAVLAHVSAVIGPEGGTLSSDATGVSVTVPPGALTASHEMFFKVFRDASMSPPVDESKGEALLSPLLMCGPPGLKFLQPVELRLPHYVTSGVNPDQWSFALKSASATRDGMPSWRQVALTDIKATQSGELNDKFVSILIDHF